MANEIQVALSMSANKNGVVLTQNLSQVSTMAGDDMSQNVQIVGTSNEAIALNDVTVGGYIVFKNLDATNYVEIFTDSGNTQPVAKLLGGASNTGDLTLLKSHPSATYYARANTASVRLLVFAVEI